MSLVRVLWKVNMLGMSWTNAWTYSERHKIITWSFVTCHFWNLYSRHFIHYSNIGLSKEEHKVWQTMTSILPLNPWLMWFNNLLNLGWLGFLHSFIFYFHLLDGKNEWVKSSGDTEKGSFESVLDKDLAFHSKPTVQKCKHNMKLHTFRHLNERTNPDSSWCRRNYKNQ